MAVRSFVVMGGIGLLLAGCAPQVPDSGVGFGDYTTYQAERAQTEAALTGAPSVGTTALAPATVPPGGIPPSDLAAAGIGVTGTTGAYSTVPVTGAPLNAMGTGASVDLNRTTGVQASPSNAAPAIVAGTSGGISQQDFESVTARESIEGDAALRAQQAAQYQVIQPTALPEQPQNVGPNIVAYALAAPNRVGQEWYSRFVMAGARFERNCARYTSPDEAQRAFLDRGGPENDPLGIDPDGDGFACAWDPSPFLAAVGRS
ncbi:MAG: hypothetical protein NTX73_09135 [Rhodobacterales bacterium]|jgi:hypothetical protein|nr:hypothetical protein [Rhodobacterales bacterium]